jgi:hypothetical protein
MQLGETVVIRLGVGTKVGEIIKINEKTIWVKLPDGNIVRRHIEKHVVR